MLNKIAYKILVNKGEEVLKEFEENINNAQDVNNELLFAILNKNKNTEFGKKNGFSNITSVEEFKEKVRLSDYSNYENYIERMAKGEKNILIKDNVEYFSHTSGTTGKQKLIPATKESRISASRYMGMAIQTILYKRLRYRWTFEKGVLINDLGITTYTEGGVPISSASSGGMRGIKKMIPLVFTSPIEVMEIRDRQKALYAHVLFALSYENLMYISGNFISNVLDFFRTMEDNKEDLINDLRNGKINDNIDIDEKIKRKLNNKLKKSKMRARQLEKEFRKGFKDIARRIWSGVVVIPTVTGGTFQIYDEKVRYYIGNIPIYSGAYAASEAIIAMNVYLNKLGYVFIPDSVFCEFIEVKDMEKSNPSTKLISELKKNHEYEVVITTRAGLYRYRIGDVIKVIDYRGKSPEVIFLYRKNQLLNMASEKTTEEHVRVAVNNTVKVLNLNIKDYTTRVDNSISPGRYVFYIEFINPNISNDKVEGILDDELRKTNRAYDRFRNNNSILRIKVVMLRKGTFENLKEKLIEKGTANGQLKIPRVVNKEWMIKYLENNK